MPWRRALCDVLSRPDHGAALGSAGCALARKAHDPRANADRMAEIYAEVLRAERGDVPWLRKSAPPVNLQCPR